jgi:hypothetical protein
MERILPCLKITHLIPPVIALVTVCVWNMAELRSQASMDQEISVLQGEISTASAVVNPRQRPQPVKIAPSATAPAIDWMAVSHLTDDSHPGTEKARLQALADFQKKLADINREAALASRFIPSAAFGVPGEGLMLNVTTSVFQFMRWRLVRTLAHKPSKRLWGDPAKNLGSQIPSDCISIS